MTTDSWPTNCKEQIMRKSLALLLSAALTVANFAYFGITSAAAQDTAVATHQAF